MATSYSSVPAVQEPPPKPIAATTRILYDHQVFSRQRAGGASRYFRELARHMPAGVQVELLLGATPSLYPMHQLSSPSVRVRAFPCPKLPGAANYLVNEALSNCIAPSLGRLDIYHPTLYRVMPGIRARAVVATHHDCTQERFPDEFRHVERVMRAKKSQYAAADAILCVSEACRSELFHFYAVDPAKTRVVHHGLTHLTVSRAATAAIQRNVRREYVLYVGSRARYKNFSGLLTAYRESGVFREFDLLALGGGPLSAQEKASIDALGVGGCVCVVPAPSDELVAAGYAGARLFVYPSFSEGFGFPPLEAMALDCPVLASKIAAVAEVCRDAPFYFDPADQDSLQRQLLCALSDEDARNRAKHRGREVAAHYSWERCARETLDLYRDCLAYATV